MASFKGLTKFEMYNSCGPVSLDTPFQLFGPVPVVGAFFELRSPQVFNHLTRSLTLHLEWQSLPEGDLSGFVVELSSGGQAQLFSKCIRVGLNGFQDSLRITLIAPDDPFGQRSYPARVVDAALHQLPPPEPPFVPVIKKILLDYEMFD